MQSPPRRFVLDLARIGGTDRRDGVRVIEPCLEEREAAVKFDAVDGEAGRGQSDLSDPMRIEDALERKVVDRDEAWRRGLAGERRVRGREPRLPVVRVKELRAPTDGALRRTEQSSDARELSE